MDETIWSLTSPRVERISGSKNFRLPPQKDFCNNICQLRTSNADMPPRRDSLLCVVPCNKRQDFDLLTARRRRRSDEPRLGRSSDVFGTTYYNRRKPATFRPRRRTSVLPSMPCHAQARGQPRFSTCRMPLRHPSCPTRRPLHSWEQAHPLSEQPVQRW